ncbi:hypothetical protein M431DRAFT_316187 [Trichoderma harzianum CBS 226.95]|uniref:Uncharacterized protein n=1 Tax=Trichoderma harzianum CBS 226.95 TaxID=983964 RepID=A0A2T4ARY4_TRIHA|nr:hypothetical protein M431DRAFT_316187 [Trichoderma harzianum CBS 226.95]PTB59837.1 hypothetical protein M431DRAFT_316187 [Trichoderma harzianum CBS 226.95]
MAWVGTRTSLAAYSVRSLRFLVFQKPHRWHHGLPLTEGWISIVSAASCVRSTSVYSRVRTNPLLIQLVPCREAVPVHILVFLEACQQGK